MDLLVIATASFFTSALTLFSGFGLGTILLPVFALFMPLPVAVGAGAVVHLSNNLFKLSLFGRHADRRVVLAFGLPALLLAVLGGLLLTSLASPHAFYTYTLRGRVYEMYTLKTVMGGLIILFAMFDWLPFFKRLAFSPRWLPLGGALSGFFGGLSGHQGALRSAFLIRQGLSKEAFIGTGVVLACVVDVARLGAYGLKGTGALVMEQWPAVLTAVAAAFLGVVVGKRIFDKVTLGAVQAVVAVGLSSMGLAMILGWI